MLNVEISSHYFKIQNKDVAIAIARDITERKQVEEEIRYINEELINQKENLEALIDNLTQTQEQLVQSEKMAALGQLIAGIAHEINTPTQYLNDNAHFLRDSFSDISIILKKNTELYNSCSNGRIKSSLIEELGKAFKDADIDYLSEEIPKAIDQSLQGLEQIAKIVKIRQ